MNFRIYTRRSKHKEHKHKHRDKERSQRPRSQSHICHKKQTTSTGVCSHGEKHVRIKTNYTYRH